MTAHRSGCAGCQHPAHMYPPCWTDEDIERVRGEQDRGRFQRAYTWPPAAGYAASSAPTTTPGRQLS